MDKAALKRSITKRQAYVKFSALTSSLVMTKANLAIGRKIIAKGIVKW